MLLSVAWLVLECVGREADQYNETVFVVGLLFGIDLLGEWTCRCHGRCQWVGHAYGGEICSIYPSPALLAYLQPFGHSCDNYTQQFMEDTTIVVNLYVIIYSRLVKVSVLRKSLTASANAMYVQRSRNLPPHFFGLTLCPLITWLWSPRA